MAETPAIVVLGAGVTGLTTTLQLLRAGYGDITVVAKHMPSDYDAEYASPLAAANWFPVSEKGSKEAEWDKTTWKALYKLATEVPAAGVWLQEETMYYRNADVPEGQADDWFKDIVLDYTLLPKSEVPPFADWAKRFRTIALDPGIYLHYLQSLCLSLNARFRRATLSHIREAFALHATSQKADLVINCSGLFASKLGGVCDESVKPIRGQLVIVANESRGMYSAPGKEDLDGSKGECCYVLERPSGGGTALGGTYIHSWSTEPDVEQSKRIMRSALEICPHLVPPGSGIEALRVIRDQVGLRPYRENGPRIEREVINDNEYGKLNIIHSYGAGGFGFQASYGMADVVTELVGKALQTSQRL